MGSTVPTGIERGHGAPALSGEDATQENNMYNQYSQQSDFAGYGSGSRLGKFASVVSSISICDSVKQIEQAVVETETILSSLYSQQIILSVFGIYLEQYNNNETTTNNDDSDAKRSIGIINAIGSNNSTGKITISLMCASRGWQAYRQVATD